MSIRSSIRGVSDIEKMPEPLRELLGMAERPYFEEAPVIRRSSPVGGDIM